MKLRTLTIFAVLLIVSTIDGKPTTQFQENKFLDMLWNTFGEDAGVRLQAALASRLTPGQAPTSAAPTNPTPSLAESLSSTNDGPPQLPPGAPTSITQPENKPKGCGEGPSVPGARITYTSPNRLLGSRAFYQCPAGSKGKTMVIMCREGGVWSSIKGWEGCGASECGTNIPMVPHARPQQGGQISVGAVVTYTCQPGYTSDDSSPNVTCQSSGKWSQPTFTCNKPKLPQLSAGLDLSALSALLKQGGGQQGANNNQNSLMQAVMKGMQQGGGMPGMSGMGGNNGLPAGVPGMPPQVAAMMAAMGGGQQQSGGPGSGGPGDMMSMMQQQMSMMGGGFPSTTPAPPPPEPKEQSSEGGFGGSGGFQLPSHLMGLLPSGMSQSAGIQPRDLMTLASAGLGSANPHTRPSNIMSLLGAANPMASLFGGGLSPGAPLGAPQTGSGRGGPPVDPEKAAERREDMMMKMMMAQAMRGMMAPRPQPNAEGNETQAQPQRNPMQDMMTMMALSQMAGGGEGRPAGGAGGMGSMMSMMSPMALLGGGGGGGGGMANMFGGLSSLFGGA